MRVPKELTPDPTSTATAFNQPSRAHRAAKGAEEREQVRGPRVTPKARGRTLGPAQRINWLSIKPAASLETRRQSTCDWINGFATALVLRRVVIVSVRAAPIAVTILGSVNSDLPRKGTAS